MKTKDTRQVLLHNWLADTLQTSSVTLTPASSDASFRRYFRVTHDSKTYILADAPPDKVDNQAFIDIQHRLEAAGLNVPRIINYDLNLGCILLSDLGDQQYLSALNPQTADALYGDALNALNTMQANTDTSGLPVYDATRLNEEMQLFPNWFLDKHMGAILNTTQQTVLDNTFKILIDSALQQPQVFVHRDYHSRNLMACQENNPGILDFQDAVKGPITYDLVSLLKDCYIEWPQQKIEKWLADYLALLNINEITPEPDTFKRWFDLMGMQRHIKVLGIFMRLYYRDDKNGYLKDIPLTWRYVETVSQRYDELKPFLQLMKALNIPQVVEALKT